MALNSTTRALLAKVSTATLCTALFKRGLRNQFLQDVHPLRTGRANMVGEAFTLRYIPAREDLNPISVFQNPDHPQRKAVEDCPPGAVLVIDSRKDARAASAGSILASRLMQRGVAGLVTDGGFRDTPDIAALDMPAYHHRPSAHSSAAASGTRTPEASNTPTATKDSQKPGWAKAHGSVSATRAAPGSHTNGQGQRRPTAPSTVTKAIIHTVRCAGTPQPAASA